MCSKIEWRKEKQWYQQCARTTRVRRVFGREPWVLRRVRECPNLGNGLYLRDHKEEIEISHWVINNHLGLMKMKLNANYKQVAMNVKPSLIGCMPPRWALQWTWTLCKFSSPDIDIHLGPRAFSLVHGYQNDWLGGIRSYLLAGSDPFALLSLPRPAQIRVQKAEKGQLLQAMFQGLLWELPADWV